MTVLSLENTYFELRGSGMFWYVTACKQWAFIRYVCKAGFSGWDKVGTLISKFEEKSWDIDIEKITVSHCHHIACIEGTLLSGGEASPS